MALSKTVILFVCGVCVCVCVCVCAQLCPTLCDLLDCRLSGSSVHGIFQVKILECVTTSSSRRSSQPRDWTHVSCISCVGRQILYHWATWEVPSFIYHSNRHLTTLVTWPFFFFFLKENWITHITHVNLMGKKSVKLIWLPVDWFSWLNFLHFRKKIVIFMPCKCSLNFGLRIAEFRKDFWKLRSLDKHLLSAVELLRMGSR